MIEQTLQPGSLVLYKDGAARVLSMGKKKIEIERREGERLSVRHKDVELLHPGPLHRFSELVPASGEVETAWELLAGSNTTLPGLAELAYEVYTPATAWAAWKLVEDGLLFQGSPQAIVARSPEEVAAEKEARAAKAAEEAAWSAFVERVQAGHYTPDDDRYLRDVEALATMQHEQSRVLRDLGRAETPENAHALLLELGYWEPSQNPYPVRLGLPMDPLEIALPPLPEEEREDLTHLRAFAIDDEGSTDADDAVSLERNPVGSDAPWRLWVHVADVAALVAPDSKADRLARERGANLYLPEGTIAMLPPAVSERLALGQGERSPALSFGLDLDGAGELTGVQVAPSWVAVTRLSYDEADEMLEEEMLSSLFDLAQRRAALRQANGAIDIDLPEVKIRVIEGEVVIRPLPDLRSRRLVLEAMLAAGEGVARYALEREIAIPFTSQDPPTEIELPTEGLAGQFAQRRAFKRSRAATVPGAHAGLGLEMYAQATSPLRRYLDLVVHQQLRAYLHGRPLLDETAILERVGAAEAVRGEVRYAERLSNEHWTLVYLLQNPEWQGEGIVVEQYGQRSKVLVPELAYELQMYLRRPVSLDSSVALRLSEVNLAERTAYFQEV